MWSLWRVHSSTRLHDIVTQKWYCFYELLTPLLYCLLRSSISLRIDAHSFLLFAVCLNTFTLNSHKSSSTSSRDLNVGLQTFLLRFSLLSEFSFAALVWSILGICFSYSKFFLVMSATRSVLLYSSLSSWLVLIFQISSQILFHTSWYLYKVVITFYR
jgi:hypothetical protein